MNIRYAALILAAGYSSRMGALKPLLPLLGSTVLESTAACFLDAGIPDVYIVLGHEAERIREKFKDAKRVTFVYNPHYERGMFTSVQAGIAAMDINTTAFLMMPGDCPMVKPSTILEITAAHERTKAPIIRPCYQEKSGHPCLFSMRYRNEILSNDFPQGMRTLMQLHQKDVLMQEVEDEAILLDMDTPKQYAFLRQMSLEAEAKK